MILRFSQKKKKEKREKRGASKRFNISKCIYTDTPWIVCAGKR